jgi:hypothetical protein
MTISAGQRLRKDLAAALAHAAKEQGRPNLEWSEVERDIIERAADTADRAQELAQLWAQQRAAGAGASTLVKISAERRYLDKAVIDFVARLNTGLAPVKSERHQRAVNARWQRDVAHMRRRGPA